MTTRPLGTTRSVRALTAAIAVTSALGLTGCSMLDGSTSSKRKGSSSSKKRKRDRDSDSSTSGNGKPSVQKNRPCKPSQVDLKLKKPTKPAGHLLLTATNTSMSTCVAFTYPQLRFDGGSPVAEAKSTRNDLGKVTLGSDESAYAGITISGGGSSKAKTLSVAFDMGPKSSAHTAASEVKLPGGSMKVSSDAKVTHWQKTADAALK